MRWTTVSALLVLGSTSCTQDGVLVLRMDEAIEQATGVRYRVVEGCPGDPFGPSGNTLVDQTLNVQGISSSEAIYVEIGSDYVGQRVQAEVEVFLGDATTRYFCGCPELPRAGNETPLRMRLTLSQPETCADYDVDGSLIPASLPPPAMDIFPKNPSVSRPIGIDFECETDGSTPTWNIEPVGTVSPVVSGAVPTFDLLVGSAVTLTTVEVSETSEWSVSCRSTNGPVANSATTTVTVLPNTPPSIPVLEVPPLINPGASVGGSCSANDADPLIYTIEVVPVSALAVVHPNPSSGAFELNAPDMVDQDLEVTVNCVADDLRLGGQSSTSVAITLSSNEIPVPTLVLDPSKVAAPPLARPIGCSATDDQPDPTTEIYSYRIDSPSLPCAITDVPGEIKFIDFGEVYECAVTCQAQDSSGAFAETEPVVVTVDFVQTVIAFSGVVAVDAFSANPALSLTALVEPQACDDSGWSADPVVLDSRNFPMVSVGDLTADGTTVVFAHNAIDLAAYWVDTRLAFEPGACDPPGTTSACDQLALTPSHSEGFTTEYRSTLVSRVNDTSHAVFAVSALGTMDAWSVSERSPGPRSTTTLSGFVPHGAATNHVDQVAVYGPREDIGATHFVPVFYRDGSLQVGEPASNPVVDRALDTAEGTSVCAFVDADELRCAWLTEDQNIEQLAWAIWENGVIVDEARPGLAATTIAGVEAANRLEVVAVRSAAQCGLAIGETDCLDIVGSFTSESIALAASSGRVTVAGFPPEAQEPATFWEYTPGQPVMTKLGIALGNQRGNISMSSNGVAHIYGISQSSANTAELSMYQVPNQGGNVCSPFGAALPISNNDTPASARPFSLGSR